MNIGWREFIKSRFRKPSQFHSVGIKFGVRNVHITTLRKVGGELQWVKQHVLNIEHWQTELKTYVEQHKLSNTRCYVALAIVKYQILQIDRPAVEEDELVAALQWSVKEHLSTDDPLVIDYFDYPASASSSSVKQINVVALAQKDVVEIRDGILKAGLQLINIGIEELAVCNLCPYSEDAVIMLKQVRGGQVSLNIVKQNQLYFSRRLNGYENIGNLSPEELAMGITDNLSLEIQRSMDYFESQLRQAPVKRVYISLDTEYQDDITKLIKEVVYVSVEKLVLSIEKENSIPLTVSNFTSLGAAINHSDLAVQ